MKKVLIVATVVCILVSALVFVSMSRNKIEYVAPVVETKKVIEQEDVLQSRINEAQEAKRTEIEANAEKARIASITQANLEIELEVTTAFRKEIEARERELQTQSKAY